MAKEAEEEELTEKTNLQIIARASMTFSDYHEKATQKQDRLQREPEGKGKNLKQLARESLNFEEFHEKTSRKNGETDV